MKKLLYLPASLIFLALSVLPAFGAPIKIGLMAPLTGSYASEGQDMQKLVTMQVEELNKNGGIHGTLVELIVEDDGSAPRSAANAANRLVSKGIKYVIGTYGSAVTEASQDIYDEAGVIQIATGSTATRLTAKGYERFFRTCPHDDDQGRVAATTLSKLGFKKIALLHDNTAYAKGLAEATKAAIKKDGIIDIIFYDALQPNERDYSTILTKLKNISPEAIMFTGYYPEAGMLLRQITEMKWSVPLIGGDGANNRDLVKIAGVDAAYGYRFISPPMPEDLDTLAAKNFLASYTKKYTTTPSSIWSVVAGDAFSVLVKALQEKGDDPAAVAAYLHTLKNFEGLTGQVGFDDKGDRIGDLYRLYETDNNGSFILQP